MNSIIMMIHVPVCVIGTPPRIDGRTVNFSILQPQLGDDPPTPFSFLNNEVAIPVRTSVSLCAFVAE